MILAKSEEPNGNISFSHPRANTTLIAGNATSSTASRDDNIVIGAVCNRDAPISGGDVVSSVAG
jgi:hypothetical protein